MFCYWKQTGIVKNFLYRNNENMVKENIENKFIYIFYRALKSLLLVSCTIKLCNRCIIAWSKASIKFLYNQEKINFVERNCKKINILYHFSQA